MDARWETFATVLRDMLDQHEDLYDVVKSVLTEHEDRLANQATSLDDPEWLP